jgi:SRSO17 transposase
VKPPQAKEKKDAGAPGDAARLFMDFCESYSPHFVGWGSNSVRHARHYLSGLLGTQRRKNIETIGQDERDSDYQGMEQLIGSSPWDHEAVMAQVADEADALPGDEEKAGLYLDESSFLKKGHASVGVKRQWSGRVGKVENCQVGGFAALGRGERACLKDFRLYLPEEWAGDQRLLDKAKVPAEHRAYQSKYDLALAMIATARERGLRFGFVGFDSLYGSKRDLVDAVEDMGERFVGDVIKTTKVWNAPPQLEKSSAKRGNPATNHRLSKANQAGYESVEALAQARFEAEHQRVKYRQGTKGELWTRVWVRPVWTWEPSPGRSRKRLLIVRRDADGGFKHSLTNLLEGQPWSHYACAQAQRFWIEHAFHEAESQLGMA